MTRLRFWLWQRIVWRMGSAMIEEDLHTKYSLNPENLDEIAYVMMCGLLGIKPRP